MMNTQTRQQAWRPALYLTLSAMALFVAGYALAAESVADVERAATGDASSSSLLVRVAIPESETDSEGEDQILFGLYDTPDGYAQERALRGQTIALSDGRAEIPLTDLPPGRYAFKVIHDRNANGRLDTGAFGIPTEPYFFSNDASDMFSAPEWEEASFRLSEGTFAYEVELD